MYSTCYQMNKEKGLVKSILSKKVIRFCAFGFAFGNKLGFSTCLLVRPMTSN